MDLASLQASLRSKAGLKYRYLRFVIRLIVLFKEEVTSRGSAIFW